MRETIQDQTISDVLTKHIDEVITSESIVELMKEIRSAMRHEKNSWAFKNEKL